MTGVASERVRGLFAEDIETRIGLVDSLAAAIATAGKHLVNCLLADAKIFICGSGGSTANCLHFAAAMHHCFEVERPALPVVNLAGDLSALGGVVYPSHADQIFARQIQALGRANDMLIVLNTTGHAPAIVQVIHAAQGIGIRTLALTGQDGSLLAQHLGAADLELRVPSARVAQIREIHLFILHCFCDLIEHALFGNYT